MSKLRLTCAVEKISGDAGLQCGAGGFVVVASTASSTATPSSRQRAAGWLRSRGGTQSLHKRLQSSTALNIRVSKSETLGS